MNTSKPLVAVVLLLSTAAAQVAQDASAAKVPGLADAWKELVAEFKDSKEAQGMVGSSLMLLHDGKVIGKEFQGFADLDTKRRVDENTIYHWASITKTFTGIAIMQLRDRKRLTLDDPIVDYVPELEKVGKHPFGPMRKITIRHLMSHSAGFRGATWPWKSKPWHPHEPTEWSQLVAMMPYTEVAFEPGSRFSYSNLGIIFLGQVIERLTGDDYEVYIDKNIFKPLGMHRSYFDHTPYHLLRYRSNSYNVTDGKPKPLGLDFDTGITVSNGGLNAPLPDMARYVAFLTGSDDAETQARYDEVLSRSSLREMWKPVLPTTPGGKLDRAIALTFFTRGSGNAKIVGHTGGQRAFVTLMFFDPRTRAGCLAAFNSLGYGGGPATGSLSSNLQRMLYERVFPLFRNL